MSPIRLMDQVRNAIRVRHYSLRTEQAYTQWIRCFIYYHNKRHHGRYSYCEFNN